MGEERFAREALPADERAVAVLGFRQHRRNVTWETDEVIDYGHEPAA